MVSNQNIEQIAGWLGNGSVNFFGKPYAGKDSQAERIALLFNARVLGGGAILRASVIPERVSEQMNRGELIDSDAYVRIVLPYLASAELADKPLMLSAVGRFTGEEHGVIQALFASGHPLKAIIHLAISDETSITRWGARHTMDRGERGDDNDKHTQETRLSEYNEKTVPVINAYRQLGLVDEIDGTMPKDDVQEAILTALAKRATLEQ